MPHLLSPTRFVAHFPFFVFVPSSLSWFSCHTHIYILFTHTHTHTHTHTLFSLLLFDVCKWVTLECRKSRQHHVIVVVVVVVVVVVCFSFFFCSCVFFFLLLCLSVLAHLSFSPVSSSSSSSSFYTVTSMHRIGTTGELACGRHRAQEK